MTLDEMMSDNYWEAEERRRLAYHRERLIKEAVRNHWMEITVVVACALGFLALMIVKEVMI